MDAQIPLYGSIECGGTTFVVAASGADTTQIMESEEFPTTTPDETLGRALAWLKQRNITALGIASFGPVDLNPSSPTYGFITATPKLKWRNANVLGPFRELGVPIGFQTDVNAAALSELTLGGHGDIRSCVYVTVGTGVGVGVVVRNQALVGLTHPEGGHIRVPRHPDDQYPGNCPYHKDCLEGLANAAAVAGRCGIHASELKNVPDDHPCWDIQAFYLAQLCVSMTLLLSPEVIVLGGGVLKRGHVLFPLVRRKTVELLNGYVPVAKITEETDKYIVPSKFKSFAGAVGSLELARLAAAEAASSGNGKL